MIVPVVVFVILGIFIGLIVLVVIGVFGIMGIISDSSNKLECTSPEGSITLMYNDEQLPLEVTDYLGVKYKVKDKTGCCLLPTTYRLGKSYDYATLLNNESSKRALFK